MISIHALREEGDCIRAGRFWHLRISIHALREEGDKIRCAAGKPPLWISIHALREEGDAGRGGGWDAPYHFYPRPPRGGRPLYSGLYDALQNFYPRPPRGGRPLYSGLYDALQNFYPRPPRGGRPRRGCWYVDCRCISIHALREEGDNWTAARLRSRKKISIHALREEGDKDAIAPTAFAFKFLSTPSARRATAKTERKPSAFVSLYTSLHKLQRDVCKPNRKITPLLAQTAGIPVRSVPENYVCCRFALAGHQKISTLSWANSGCSPTCSTLVW